MNYLKKIFSFILILLFFITLGGCKEDVELKIILEGKKQISLLVGEEYKIHASIDDGTEGGNKFTYVSSNNEVLSVAENGLVKGISKGNAYITITYKSDTSITEKISIQVKEAEVKAEKIEIASESTITVGRSMTLKAVVTPDNATSKAVKWEVSDTNLASIDESGNFKALNVGLVTVKATSILYEDIYCEKEIEITEKEAGALEKIVITNAKNYLVIGLEYELGLTFTPEDFPNQDVIWQSSNEKVATVENGIVTPISAGKCKITCVSQDNDSISSFVEFEVIPDTLVIVDYVINNDLSKCYDIDTYTIDITQTANPSATSTCKTQFTYISGDEEIIKFVKKGTFETLKTGNCIITVIEEISGIEKTIEVEVVESPALEGLEVVGREITTEDTITLTITPIPEHANYNVTWESLDTSIATIDENGLVTPLKAGEGKFKAIDKDTNIEVIYNLVINKAFDPNEGPEKIEIIYGSSTQLYVGYELRLSVDVTPAGVSSQVTWELNKNSAGIAQISEDGVLKALAEGTARVRAISKVNGVKSNYLAIQIVNKPEPKPIPDLNGYEIVIMNAEGALYEIDPFYSKNGIEYTLADKLYKQKAWKDVQDEYNCTIKVEAYPATAPWGTQRINYIINNATNGTSECDFAVVSGAWINQFVSGNSAVDTTRYFELYGMNQVEKALYEVGSKNDKYYCVSNGINPGRTYVIKGLFYNYGLIKELGLESPAKLFNEGKWTYEGFIEYCLKAQSLLPDNSYVMSGGPSIVWAGMVNAAGIKLADTQKMDLNITHKYSIQAIETLTKIVDEGCWSIDEIGYDAENVPFREKRAIFSPGEYWFLRADNRYPKDMWGDNTEYGYVPFPYPSQVNKEDTKVNFSGESVMMMVAGRKYPAGVNEEGVYRALQDVFLRTIDSMKNDPTYDSERIKRNSLTSKVDDEESVEATIYYTASRTMFDPMFDESFQYEYSGDLTTAVINSVKGSDAQQEFDAVYNKVLTAFRKVYA